MPLADQFREDAVELMHQQGLESCALAAKAMVFPPGPPKTDDPPSSHHAHLAAASTAAGWAGRPLVGANKKGGTKQ